MQKIIPLYKPIGKTPLEIVDKVKATHPDLAKVKIGYAGRLDPLAHGVLLLMIGDETKKRVNYLSLPKSYEFTVCFGLRTDTYDTLGIVQSHSVQQSEKNVNIFVNRFVNKYQGKIIMHYPPYSSKPVHGKPLFWWARNNKLNEIIIPKHEIEIFTFDCLSIGEISIAELRKKIDTANNTIQGDFRQNEIKYQWDQLFSKADPNLELKTATFSITCSSGTYIRELVNVMGEELGCGAIAIDILRTAVGEYTINNTQTL